MWRAIMAECPGGPRSARTSSAGMIEVFRINPVVEAIAVRRCIPELLLVGSFALLSSAPPTARAEGHGGAHGAAHGGHFAAGEDDAGRHIGFHSEYQILPFPSFWLEPWLVPAEAELGPGPPAMYMYGPFDMGPDQMVAGYDHAGHAHHVAADHHPGTADHHHVQVHHASVVGAMHAAGQAETSHQTTQQLGESHQAGAGTAQPDPSANPSFQRPPGAVGPGSRALGLAGPGRPGPGRRARPPL
jgi:hypothetical protein